MKIHSCYCQIPLPELVDLVRLRFVEGIPTEELMKRMKSEKERGQVAVVALLDVKKKDLIEMVEAEDPSQLRHLLDCRAHARELLTSRGFKIKEKQKVGAKAKFVLLGVGLVAFSLIFRLTPLSHFLVKENILSFFETLRGKGWGPSVFILIYALGCVVALPGSVLTLAGGAVFGTVWGTIYNVIASNLGATLAFFTARYFGRDFIQGLLRGKKLAEFDAGVARSGFKTIFRLRLVPLVPFNGLNFGAGLSAVHYPDYLLGSFLGMLPATFIYTYFADALLKGVEGASEKAFLHLTIAGLLLILISFLPSIYKKMRGRGFSTPHPEKRSDEGSQADPSLRSG